MSEYAERDLLSLSPYYERHVSAMTGEKLHSKSDIAAELAWRDKRRDDLLAALKDLVGGLDDTTWSSWQTTAHFSGELEKARAAIKSVEESK